MAAAFLAGLLITMSVAALILQNRQISYQRDRAMEMTAFSSGMFEVDPFLWTIDSERTTGSILWFNLQASEDRLSADPLLRRDQLILLAKGHLITNHSNESLRLARQAVAVNQALPDPMRIDEQKTMNDQGAMLIASGDVVEASKLLDAALRIGRTRTETDILEISRSLALKALCDWSMSNVSAAKRHLQSALRVTNEALGDDAIEVINLRALLGYLELHENLGSEEAITLLKDVVGQLESQERSARLRRGLFDTMVEAHTFRGEYHHAIASGKRSFALPPEVLGSGFASLILKLGTLNFIRGELVTAARYLNMGIDAFGEIFVQRALLMNSARAQLALGELIEARLDCDLTSLLSLRRKRGGIGGPNTKANPNLMVIALIHLWQGKPDQASTVAVQALESIDLGYFRLEWELESYASGAQVYHELGDDITATKLADRAISIADGLSQSWSPWGVRARHLRAEILLASSRAAEALTCLAELGEIIENQQSIDPSPRINEQLANSHRIQGNLHQVEGEPELAKREWREALGLLALNPDGAIGADHHLIAGEVHLRLGETALAAEHARVLFDKGWRHPEWVAALGG